MKLFPEIQSKLADLNETKFQEIVNSKFDSNEHSIWMKFVEAFEYRDLHLNNDTTGENCCFSSFVNLSKDSAEGTIGDMFYIHKSYNLDYFSLYIKSRVKLKRGDKSITYPDAIIMSPIGYYENTFEEIWGKVKDSFPSAVYVPFMILESNAPQPVLGRNSIYEILFGYEGNILEKPKLGRRTFFL